MAALAFYFMKSELQKIHIEDNNSMRGRSHLQKIHIEDNNSMRGRSHLQKIHIEDNNSMRGRSHSLERASLISIQDFTFHQSKSASLLKGK